MIFECALRRFSQHRAATSRTRCRAPNPPALRRRATKRILRRGVLNKRVGEEATRKQSQLIPMTLKSWSLSAGTRMTDIVYIVLPTEDDATSRARRPRKRSSLVCAPLTPNLPTNITPIEIAWLKLSGKSPMDLGIPPLRIKIMLESNPLKSIMLVGRLAVRSFLARASLRSSEIGSSADSTPCGCNLDQRKPISMQNRIVQSWLELLKSMTFQYLAYSTPPPCSSDRKHLFTEMVECGN